MARPDVNRFGEMEVFIRVVETGGFTAAAQQCGMTPSAVSKLVARLEDRLGARLFNRSTRRQQLTAEGAAFYERSLRILADLDEAEREASVSAEPQGRVRISCNLPVGRQFLIPALPLFFERYPGVNLDLQLTDEVVDLLEVRADVAVRSGPLRDSRLVARSLGESGHKIVAAPEYLARHGTPQHPRELGDYNCVGFSYRRVEPDWPFLGKPADVPEPSGNLLASDGDSVRHLALAGLGLARLAEFQVREDIAAGRLVEVLADFNPGDRKPMHALYLGKPGHLPARVRAVLDFLAEHVRID